jgi:hypothetical protein
MASTYVGFQTFPQDFLTAKHNFDVDVFHVALTNTLPSVVTAVAYPDIVEVANGGGYLTGGKTIPVDLSLVGGVTLVFGDPIVWTGGVGGFGPFQYAVLFNYSQADQRLVGYWAYPSSISLLEAETLTLVPDPTNGLFKVVGP